MRSLKTGIVGGTIAALFGTFLGIGCSASGELGSVMEPTVSEDPTESEDEGRTSAVLPPSNPDPGPGKNNDEKDAGAYASGDAGSHAGDAGVDASVPPPPEPGDTCSTVDEITSRTCSMCGKQEAICENVDGGLSWSEYGPCGDKKGVCEPGETRACGNCGTQTCSAYCGWGPCTGEPQPPKGGCSPGSVQFISAGCPDGGRKSRTCDETCMWGFYSLACESPTTPNKMTIPSVVGAVESKAWTLDTKTTPKPAVTCSGSVTPSSVRYIPVEVSNPSAQAAEISAYHTKSTTGKELDTVLWVYNGDALPMTDAERGACVGKVSDNCSITGSPCGGEFAFNLAGLEKITIPAGGKILVFSAAFSASTDVGDGTFVLNLRTDELQ